MATKRRIHQVAKEFNISNEALIEYLKGQHYNVKSLMTALTDEMYGKVLKKYQKEPSKQEEETEFRKQIREKKLEEEVNRTKARQAIDERMRVATKFMETRSLRSSTLDEGRSRKSEIPKKDKVESDPKAKRKSKDSQASSITPPKDENPKKVKTSSKDKPSLEESIASLIPQEDLIKNKPKTESPVDKNKTVSTKSTTKSNDEVKKNDGDTSSKPRRRRRKKKTSENTETNAETSSEVSKVATKKDVNGKALDDKSQKKGKKRKKRKISEEEISQSIRKTLVAMEAGGGKTKFKHRKTREDDELEGEDENLIQTTEFISVSELAALMDVEPGEVITKCLGMGIIVSINQRLDADTIVMVADEFDYNVEITQEYGAEEFAKEDDDAPDDLNTRPSVVTIMGHVDHGKTSLLDYIRKSNITDGESGGITQHIGAYNVDFHEKKITFLDTPGHEAFTAMRARGAQATDIVILVVSADDGVQQQTLEAISHAKAAEVPTVIAINKIDKPDANPEVIKQQLSQHDILVESWGGKYQSAEISAKTGQGIDHLLELVILEAELLDLKANANRPARGVVIEAELDKGKGPIATVLVQNGTLRVGDPFIAGNFWGKVRTIYDEHNHRLKEVPPSTPCSGCRFFRSS